MKPAPLKGRTWNPYTIPDVIDPGGVRCIKVYIPDSLQWLQIFAAVMDTMCHWKNYELLGDTSAAQCAALMRSIQQTYNTFVDCDECPPSTIIDELEYEMSVCEQLRFQDGKLQGLCCGTWSDLPGQPSQGWLPGATGTGTTPPAAGGACQTYNAAISGNGLWLAPFVVNTGDTIQVTAATGATYDTVIGNEWHCPDGNIFFAGACLPSAQVNAGNPLPSILTGKLVAKIGSTFYDVYNGTFTVPASITSQPLQFQFNYASIAGSSGDVSFKVTFCNNVAASWTKVFDFTTNPYSTVWSIPTATSATPPVPQGVYVPGAGYRTALVTFSTSWIRNIAIVHSKTFTQTSMVIEFTYTGGTWGGSTTDDTFVAVISPGGVRIGEVFSPTVPVSPKNDVATRSVTGMTVAMNSGHNFASADPGGVATITKITINGTGTNPF